MVKTIKSYYPSLRLRAVTYFGGTSICGISNWL
jgi:hypothetical protein